MVGIQKHSTRSAGRKEGKFLQVSFQIFHSYYSSNVKKLEKKKLGSTNSLINRVNKLMSVSYMPKVQKHPSGLTGN